MTQRTATATATATATTTTTTQPPTPPTTTTYTSIPISAGDVITRSLQNLTTTITRHLRPWPELISIGSITRPDSISTSFIRLRINSHYFLTNYSIIVTFCGALSLIGSPFSLMLLGLVFALWLLLFFFREDPLVLWEHHASDRLVFMGLVLVSVLVVWVSGCLESLVVGVVIGVFVCGVHAVLRNSDGLIVDVDQHESASTALIGSGSGHGYGYGAVSEIYQIESCQ